MEFLELAANTDVGKQRQDNQDTFINMKLWTNDQALIGVIDGVGGYEGGDKAAAIAKESIEQYMSTPKGDALSMLKEAVVFANNKIDEERASDPALSKMCCVLTIAVADAKNQTLYYVHVGDTRLYRFRNGHLEKITKDHSLVGVREDAGELNEEESMQHSLRNVILRQVGSEFHRIDDPEFLDFGQTDFTGGDILLLCSDGLSDMINRAQISVALEKQTTLPSKVKNLIALANQMGGNDNITVVLAKNKSKQKPIHQQKKTAAATLVPLAEAEAQPATPAITTSAPPRKNYKIIGAILAGIIVLAAVWWFTRPAETPVTSNAVAGNNAVTINNSTAVTGPIKGAQGNFNIDSLIAETIRGKGRELLLERIEDDTIRLTSPIQLRDISRVIGTRESRKVLIPSSGASNAFALNVIGNSGTGKKDTIRISNLMIKGFETGIKVQGKAVILLDDVLFDDVKNPVSYQVSVDSSKMKTISFE